MREAQVVACLNDGLTEPRAIVDKLYEGLPEALVAFAELNVRAHIEKIRDDQAG